MSRTLRFFLALIRTNLKASLALRAAFLIEVGFMMLNNVVFFSFWWLLLARVPHVGGWRLPDVAALFGTTAAGYGLAVTLAGGAAHLGHLIDEGELDAILAQPKPVLLSAVGSRSEVSGIGDLVSGLVLILLSGLVRPIHAPLVVLAVLASAVVFASTAVVFFSLAFWLPRSEPIGRQLWGFVIVFSTYPEPMFGGLLRLVLFTVIPAGLVGFLPAAIVREPTLTHVLWTLAGAAGSLGIAIGIFYRGLRRYASGSRFGVLG